MKKWWKVSICALAATFALPAVTSCDKKSAGKTQEEIKMEKLEALGDVMNATLADMKSFDFGGNLTMITEQVIPDGNNSNYIGSQSYGVEATASLTDSGLEAKMLTTATYKESIQSMPEYDYERTTLGEYYLVDGFIYEQDEENPNFYHQYPQSVDAAIAERLFGSAEVTFGDVVNGVKDAKKKLEVLEKLGVLDAVEDALFEDTEYDGFEDFFGYPELPELSEITEMSELFAMSADLFAGIFANEFTLVEEGETTTITLDLKDEIDGIFTFVDTYANIKLGDLVNAVLGSVSEGLTWQEITSEIKDKGDVYTVKSLVDSLDSEIYQASGFRLQEVKDILLSQEGIYSLIEKEYGWFEAARIRAYSVADFVHDNGKMTVNEYLKEKMGPSVTLSGLVGEWESYLIESKLGDLIPSANAVLSTIKDVEVHSCNATLVFNVKDGKITSVENSYNVKLSIPLGENQKMTMAESYSLYANNFSSESQEIALPSDITIDTWCNVCQGFVDQTDYCYQCKQFICERCHYYRYGYHLYD